MKILVEIENEKVQAELSKVSEHEHIKWIGYANGYTDNNYKIVINQNRENHDHTVELGTSIQTNLYDIKEQFIENVIEIEKRKLENEGSGIENTEEDEDKEEINPYDPELIRVDPRHFGLSYIYEMIESEENELDLSPEFQRNFVWNDITRKSRLIESLLLRIPIPVFYFSQDKDGKFKVVDGVQRLTVIKSFMNNEFKLKNLEYLKECEGKYFKKREGDKKKMDYLDGKYVRRINQTQIICNIIDPQTPAKVKFDIFKRINTGGKTLNPQEIRNCLVDHKVRNLLKEMANSKEFRVATGNSISSTRMADQELVLRFIGFYYYKVLQYRNITYKGNMDSFLDNVLSILNEEKEDVINQIEKEFYNSMKNAYYLFGKYAFRKCKTDHILKGAKKQLLNKSLFVTISILLADYEYEQIESKFKRNALVEPFAKEIESNKKYFDVLTNGTSDFKRLNDSFKVAGRIIREKLGGVVND